MTLTVLLALLPEGSVTVTSTAYLPHSSNKILNYVQEADVDDEIPPTSLVREFIGGNSFYK